MFVNGLLTRAELSPDASNRRTADRKSASLPARLVWRDDANGLRVVDGVARDIGQGGLFVQAQGGEPIPLHRLVYVQLSRDVGVAAFDCRRTESGALSAVCRVVTTQSARGERRGYALRLLGAPVFETPAIPPRLRPVLHRS
jgi:hypothetical protein